MEPHVDRQRQNIYWHRCVISPGVSLAVHNRTASNSSTGLQRKPVTVLPVYLGQPGRLWQCLTQRSMTKLLKLEKQGWSLGAKLVVVARLAWQEAVSKLSWETRVGHISRLAAGLHFFSVFCNLRKTMA